MNTKEQQKLSDSLIENATMIFKELSDPIELAIVIELIRHPNITPNELKKRISLPGSRIYHFLNKLISKKIIIETETEQLTSHLSRRKFKVSTMFEETMNNISILGHESPNKIVKAYHLFEIHSTIAVLEKKLRELEKVPDRDIQNHLKKSNLPFPNLFYIDNESLPQVIDLYKSVREKGRELEKKNKSIINLIQTAQYNTLFGIYDLD